MDYRFYDYESENGDQLIIALDEAGNTLGELAYQVADGVVEVTDIFVFKESEENSIENDLLDELLDRIKQTDTVYYVHATFPENEDSKYMISAFSNREKFYMVEDSNLYYIYPQNRKDNPSYDALKKFKGEVNLFSEIGIKERKAFYDYIADKQIDFFSLDEEHILAEDISLCRLDKNNRVSACILFKKTGDKELELAYMMMVPGNEKDLGIVMAEAMRIIDERYSDYLITIDALSVAADVLIEKIFGESVKKEAICTAFNI